MVCTKDDTDASKYLDCKPSIFEFARLASNEILNASDSAYIGQASSELFSHFNPKMAVRFCTVLTELTQ